MGGRRDDAPLPAASARWVSGRVSAADVGVAATDRVGAAEQAPAGVNQRGTVQRQLGAEQFQDRVVIAVRELGQQRRQRVGEPTSKAGKVTLR